MAKIKKFKPNSKAQHTTLGALTLATIYTNSRFSLTQRKNHPGVRVTAINTVVNGNNQYCAVDFLNSAGVITLQKSLPMSKKIFIISW